MSIEKFVSVVKIANFLSLKVPELNKVISF